MKTKQDADAALIKWLTIRLSRCLPIDRWQRPELERLLTRLKTEPRTTEP